MPRAEVRPKCRELTLDEYLLNPETKLRHEVIDGTIVMSPSPTFRHQLVLGRLHLLLSDHTSRHGLGTVVLAPADLLIVEHPKLRVRQPDLMFIREDRISRGALKQVRILATAVDLAVEILSTSDHPARWAEKCADYAAIRVPELWLVDPDDEFVEVHGLADHGYVLRGRYSKNDEILSPTLPGLALPVHSIFE